MRAVGPIADSYPDAKNFSVPPADHSGRQNRTGAASEVII